MESIDWMDFVMKMRAALYQCGQISIKLKGKVEKHNKAKDSEVQTSTSVTTVDGLCQEIIFLLAHAFVPWIEIYSEDLAECPSKIVKLFANNVGKSHYVLVVDSLDGTDHYLDGGKLYAHMLGVLDTETGRMVCEMIYFPELEELYFGVRGKGSFVVKGLAGQPATLAVPGGIPKTFHRIKRLTTTDIDNFIGAGFLIVGDDKPKSSAIQMLEVISGNVGVLIMRGFHGHDTIGGLIVEELGGLVLGSNGQFIRYDKTMPRTPLVIASLVPDYANELYKAQKEN